MTNNQQLAAHCRDVIANPQDHLDWVVDMAMVALASVDAEETYMRLFGHYGYGDSCWVECGSNEEGAQRFYTAPPVAVMQPVKLPQGYAARMGHDVCRPGGDVRPVLIPDDRGNWLDRHAVEFAIRAAGGDIEP